MCNLIEDITETKARLEHLLERKEKFQALLRTLEIGGEVYLSGAHGGWDEEYYPQVIKQIDVEGCKIQVHEKSINVTKWVSTFYTYNDTTKKFEYRY